MKGQYANEEFINDGMCVMADYRGTIADLRLDALVIYVYPDMKCAFTLHPCLNKLVNQIRYESRCDLLTLCSTHAPSIEKKHTPYINNGLPFNVPASSAHIADGSDTGLATKLIYAVPFAPHPLNKLTTSDIVQKTMVAVLKRFESLGINSLGVPVFWNGFLNDMKTTFRDYYAKDNEYSRTRFVYLLHEDPRVEYIPLSTDHVSMN